MEGMILFILWGLSRAIYREFMGWAPVAWTVSPSADR